jgi:hypothetical protein
MTLTALDQADRFSKSCAIRSTKCSSDGGAARLVLYRHDRAACRAAATQDCFGLARRRITRPPSRGAFLTACSRTPQSISSAQRGPALGAINGTILIDGLACGGPTQARTGLRRYWEGLVGTMPGFGSLLSISGEAAAMTPLESVPPYVE